MGLLAPENSCILICNVSYRFLFNCEPLYYNLNIQCTNSYFYCAIGNVRSTSNAVSLTFYFVHSYKTLLIQILHNYETIIFLLGEDIMTRIICLTILKKSYKINTLTLDCPRLKSAFMILFNSPLRVPEQNCRVYSF